MTKPFAPKTIAACLETGFGKAPPAAAESEPAAGIIEPVLDQSVIGDLKEIGGSDALFRRVLDLFAACVPQAVDTAKCLAASGDLAALASAAHALKSICGNVGARRATQACHELEIAALNGEAFGACEKIGVLDGEMRIVLAEIERLRAA